MSTAQAIALPRHGVHPTLVALLRPGGPQHNLAACARTLSFREKALLPCFAVHIPLRRAFKSLHHAVVPVSGDGD